MLSCDSVTEETIATLVSIGYIVMGFDVLACDKYGYSMVVVVVVVVVVEEETSDVKSPKNI